jgi:hypothetical protein
MAEARTAEDKAKEMFTQSTGKAVDGLTVWADANQRVLREMAELCAVTAREGVRLYAEMQQSMLEAMRDAQATTLRWQSTWQDAPRDPMAWYQRTMAETVDGAQKAFRLVEGSAQAVSRSTERLQTSTEQAGRGIQDAMTAAATKLKDLYAA